MADTKISGLTALTGANTATNDQLAIADTSAVQTKSITMAELLEAPVVTDAGGYITATSVNGALQEGFNGKCAVNTVATSGATETLTLHPIQKVTMDQACTFTFPTPTTAGHIFMLHLIGAFDPTWPASVDWADASEPTYASPSWYVFWTDDSGTTWFGSHVGGGFA